MTDTVCLPASKAVSVFAFSQTHVEWRDDGAYYVVPRNPTLVELGPFVNLQVALDLAKDIEADCDAPAPINWWFVGAMIFNIMAWVVIGAFLWFLWAHPWPPAGWGRHSQQPQQAQGAARA